MSIIEIINSPNIPSIVLNYIKNKSVEKSVADYKLITPQGLEFYIDYKMAEEMIRTYGEKACIYDEK